MLVEQRRRDSGSLEAGEHEERNSHVTVTIYDSVIPTFDTRLQELIPGVAIRRLTADEKADPAVFAETMQGSDVVIVRSATQLTGDILENPGKVKVIGRAGVGVDNVNVTKATEQGIVVVNCPRGNTNAAAEHAALLTGAVARRIVPLAGDLQAGKWQTLAAEREGIELQGKTALIVGFGNVGKRVGEIYTGFGMRLSVYDPYIRPEAKQLAQEQRVQFFDTLEEALPQADVVTLHAVLTDETRGMIGQKELELMKETAILVNAGRGGLIDEEALAKALQEKKIAGAGLDVFEEEGKTGAAKIQELFGPLRNVVVTPHVGASTEEAGERIAIELAENVAKALQYGTADGAVNAPRLSEAQRERIAPQAQAAVHAATIARDLLGEQRIQAVNIAYTSEIDPSERELLTKLALQEIVRSRTNGNVTIVNAEQVAQRQGIAVSSESATTANYTKAVQVRIMTENGEEVEVTTRNFREGGEKRSGTHIVSLNHVNVHIPLVDTAGHSLLVVSNEDRPGALGAVAGYLGDHSINVSDMSLASSRRTGSDTALMAYIIDRQLTAEELAELSATPSVSYARSITLR